MKKWLSLLLILAVLFGFAAPAAATTEEPDEIIWDEETAEVDPIPDLRDAHRDIPTKNLDANGIPAVTSTPQAKWIDRLDNPPAYVRDLYNWLAENSDGDGVEDALIDPTTLDMASNRYYVHTVAELNPLKVTFSHSGGNLSSAGSAAVNADKEKQKAAFVGYLVAAYAAFSRDYAGVFWFSGTGYYLTQTQSATYQDRGGGVGEATYGLKFSIILLEPGQFDTREVGYQNKNTIYSTIRERDSLVKNLAAQATGTRYEQVQFLNTWLTANNGYNTTADLSNISYDCRNGINALRGKAGTSGPICEGYARALKMVCDKLNIPCVLVDGRANGGNHMWNYVQMEDGNWYAVDVTWNDPFVDTSNPLSGAEWEGYLLIGKNTDAAGTVFSQSHVVENSVYVGYTKFLNGPVLAAERYQYAPNGELTIVSQPKSLVSTPGATVNFTVGAQGSGLTYQWKFKNATDKDFRNTSLPGNQTATLTVSNLNGPTHHGRQYKCVIRDANGAQVETDAVTLTVAYFVNDAKSQSTKIGENAVFTVKFSDIPGVTYRWEYKGNTASSTWANTSATGNKTNTLTVPGKATNHRYMYRCKITVPGIGTVYSKEVYLNIAEDPATITAQPADTSAVSGDYAYFEIAAEGEGLIYNWQWSDDGVSWNTTKSTGYNTNRVRVKTNNFIDGRYYRCQVKTYNGNSYHTVNSQPVQLTVLPAAEILEAPRTVTVKAGQQAVFSVVAEGEGLTYQWQWAKFKGNWKNTTMTGATTDTLITNAATAEMNGRYYRVVITNRFGGYVETVSVQLFVE